MVNFAELFKKQAELVGETIQDVQKEEQEVADYKEKAAEKGESLFEVVTKVKKIRDKHEKKRKEIAQNTSAGPTKSEEGGIAPGVGDLLKGGVLKTVTIDLNQSETKIEKEPKKTLVKQPKKVSQLSGKDTKTPKVSKETQKETVDYSKPYKTKAGDVTASSEDPEKKPLSLALIALVGGAIGLGAYFYLRTQ